jgi:hypothetical protein
MLNLVEGEARELSTTNVCNNEYTWGLLGLHLIFSSKLVFIDFILKT